MEQLNNTPLLLLRSQNLSFKAKQKKLNKRIRNKKHLREEIYSNHNIFQSTIDLYRNKTAQNIIWDKNYTFKCLINQVKDQNSSLKGRIWNLEKENRRMERQIQSWNLSEGQTKKPDVDMATVETVLKDQDYHIVSMKMEIHELQNQLHLRQQEYIRIVKQNSEVSELCRMLNHQIALKKVQMYQCMGSNKSYLQGQSKDNLSRTLMRQNQQLQMVAKNMELKKKSKNFIQTQLTNLTNECNQRRQVTPSEIAALEAQTLKMRTEEDGGLSLERQKLKLAQKVTRQFQCFAQQQMDRFIQLKMPLETEISRIKEDIEQWQAQKIKFE